MTAWVQVGERTTTVRVANDAGAQEIVTLGFGALGLARSYFRQEPPSAGDMEAAIEVVEDALMPAIAQLRGHGPLHSHDAESLALVEAAGLPTDATAQLGIEEVERVFNRLVNVANGRPAASEGLPARNTFAAHLLILRELMHHAGRTTLIVTPASPTGEGP